MKTYCKNWLTAIAMLMSSCVLFAQAETSTHYKTKAAFLYNFTQFVEWPASAFEDANSPFVIGILGENVFGTSLNDVVRDEKVNGRAIVIKQFASAAEIKNCHILFISATKESTINLSLTNLHRQNILSVSDAGHFSPKGSIITFVDENNEVRFTINLEAAKEAELKFSSKLLRLAQITESKN